MTITEQKAFLQTYTGKAQAPAHPAQDWADAVKELHFEAQTAPVEFANAYGVYERLTITYEGCTVTARVIRPDSAGQHPLLLMYHDLNRGVRGWHHMTRFLALGFGTVALEAEPYKGDWLADPAQAEFRTRYKDALAVAKAALALPWVDAERVCSWRGLRRRTGTADGLPAAPGEALCGAESPARRFCRSGRGRTGRPRPCQFCAPLPRRGAVGQLPDGHLRAAPGAGGHLQPAGRPQAVEDVPQVCT